MKFCIPSFPKHMDLAISCLNVLYCAALVNYESFFSSSFPHLLSNKTNPFTEQVKSFYSHNFLFTPDYKRLQESCCRNFFDILKL